MRVFEAAAGLDPEVRAAYLSRLGAEAEAPSVESLRLLMQRQVERVAYETLWIHAGESWSIEPGESAARIAVQGRGGYCYHTNGALGALLSSLGYAVRGHVGGVHGPEGPNAAVTGNHLVLTVDQLPSEDNPGGVWYVDAGLGDALHEPLPLLSGAYDQAPFHLSLEPVEGDSGWHFTHDPLGGFRGMTWTSDEARIEDFAAQHHWLSTSPDSGFVKVAMAERRDATGVDVIRGLVLTRIGDGARTAEPLTRRTDWFEALAEVFDLRFDSSSADGRDRLWTRVLDAHRHWETTQH